MGNACAYLRYNLVVLFAGRERKMSGGGLRQAGSRLPGQGKGVGRGGKGMRWGRGGAGRGGEGGEEDEWWRPQASRVTSTRTG